MKIKRFQKTGNIQFEVVSHFDNKNAVKPREALLKIMLNKANEKLKAANKTVVQQAQ